MRELADACRVAERIKGELKHRRTEAPANWCTSSPDTPKTGSTAVVGATAVPVTFVTSERRGGERGQALCPPTRAGTEGGSARYLQAKTRWIEKKFKKAHRGDWIPTRRRSPVLAWLRRPV